ncbi:DEAD/DEAH box helicase [Candidatus Woesearchaeota archaeon]|nr:DEAD/DEAH box helicase [Candidatus Woesearchaeota archaeon]
MALKTEKPEEIKDFKGFKLDRFQIEAIQSIEKNNSVVVSAATGTGKTLIADYIIDKCLKEKEKVIYTAPIKALSNQKYRDFKKQYGEENVGIMTGDVTINPEAPIKIMTTEIYRNMLLAKDPETEKLPYVIFDEIHYLGDIERGTVWEESVIFSHENTRFLCLSATIPNARQFANWIEHIKKHTVDVVTEKKRAVPLTHQFYDDEKGFATLKEIQELKELDKYPKYHKAFKNKKRYLEELKKRKKKGYLDLIHELETKNNLPCIYFCFSRMLTQKKAELLKTKKNYLTAEQTTKVTKYVREKLNESDESVKRLETTKILRECLKNGIAFHNAGILPVLKEIVEELFAQGLIKALFATETFAVGINMPAKTVCFDSLEKFDGIQFRYLNSKEYFQLAGRAGRRGIDKQGYAISMIDRQFSDLKKIEKITDSDSEPLISQFKLSFNTVLNMVHSHTEEEIAVILQSSLFSYQQTGRQSSQRIINSFNKKKKKLYQLGYILKGLNGDELTEKGLFAMRIYTMEILTTEIFCSSLTPKLTNIEIFLIVGRITYEERKNIKFKGKDKTTSNKIYKKLQNYNYPQQFFKENPIYTIEPFLKSWYEGCEFEELLNLTTMPEGDIVRYIRQTLDLMQQIQHATLNSELKEKIKEIQQKIDRDVIAVRF